MIHRIRIVVSYDGTGFHGWQVQPGLPTIQGTIQDVLAQIEGGPVQVHGSGRTDAGVHALAQVAAFDLRNPIPAEKSAQSHEPIASREIRVVEAGEAAVDFHPRFYRGGQNV